MQYLPQDIAFISDVYASVSKGCGIEKPIERYTRNFPDIRFAWQAQCYATQTYFAITPFNYDDDVWRDYPEVAHLNPLPAKAAQFPVSEVVKTRLFISREDYERTDIYDLFFRYRDNLNESMGLWAFRSGEDAALLTVDIPDRYSAADRLVLEQSLSAILPHLQNAFQLMLDIDLRRCRLSDHEFWLDTLPSAAMVIDAENRVIARNIAAERFLSGSAGIMAGSRGRLLFSAIGQSDAVISALSRARRTAMPVGPFAIAAPSPHRLKGYCLPIGVPALNDPVVQHFGMAQRDTLFIVSDAADLQVPSEQLLATTLDITPAEARIVATLCSGGDLREAAQTIGISYHTARAQLASASRKLDLSRQTELVSIALRTTAPFTGLKP